jgi:sigma-E factor negative regulatory protein RseB
MIRRLALTLCAVLVAVPWALGSFSPTDAAGQGSSAAAPLVAQMRDAAAQWAFGGNVALTWRDPVDSGKVRRANVDVTAAYGTVEVAAGANRIVDNLGTTYVLGDKGWSTVLIAPLTHQPPSADHEWTLSSRPGPTIAGRATTAVTVSRDGRGVVQRLFLDDDTKLLLGRDVIDADGRIERSLRFTTFGIQGGPRPIGPQGESSGTSLRHVPADYVAPSSTKGGYELIAKANGSDGGVQLSYSDGIFSVTIGERTGELDWDALAKGGTSATVAGHAARVYAEPGGTVIVWQGDNVVFTCVSDAPMDVTATMISGLSPAGRSTIERIADYVLGPFGWH